MSPSAGHPQITETLKTIREGPDRMSYRNTCNRLLSAASATLLAGVLAAGPALAAPASAPDTVADVIVTAQKRSENLQKVPLAVSVASQETLRDNAIGNAESLDEVVPSLTFKKGTANVNSTLSIRGIGTQSFSSGAEPSVSTVVDGVVFGRSGMAFQEFTNLDHIEVLRGPQGTLFGKNSSAGAVNIVTKGPTAAPTGDVSVSAFQHEEYRADANFSGPLNDKMGYAVSAVYGDFKGNIFNNFTNKWTNGYRHQGLRGTFTNQMADNLLLTLRADYVKADDNCCADVLGPYVPGTSPIANVLLPSLKGVQAYYGSKRVYDDLTPGTRDDNGGLSAQYDWDLKGIRITSISAWRNWRNKQIRDGDFHATNSNYASAIDVADRDYGALNFNQFSEELRVSSTGEGKLQYVAGLFLWNTHENDWFNRFVDQCTASTLAVDATTFKPCSTAAGASTLIHGQAPAHWTTNFWNQAVFGQATYAVSDALKLIGGLRLSHDRVSYSLTRDASQAFGAAGIAASFSGAEHADKMGVSGKLGAEYQLSADQMLYATYSRGYKGPSLNDFYSESAVNKGTIAPETSNAYEIGAKSQFFGRRLTLNADVFWEDFEHFQANTFVLQGTATFVTLGDAGNVRSKGLELDATWRATPDLTISGGYTFDDATIVSYNCAGAQTLYNSTPTTGNQQSLAKCLLHNGRPLPFAPKNKFNVTGAYDVPVPKSLPFDLKVSSTYTYTSTINFDLDQSDFARQKSYGLWDLQATFSTRDGRYRLAFIGKNLTNQYYTTFVTPGGAGPAPGTLAPLRAGSFSRLQVPRDATAYVGVRLTASY
jgi:iron complex outermembrane recepter protein